MALVMLPCDLPWWSSICKRLTLLQQTDDTYMILEIMLRIHDLCNVSLDPDEDKRDATIFDGLKNYMLNEMTDEECQRFKTVTIRNLAKRAQSLKAVRPPRGLSFSLQQQPDKVKLSYDLVAALLANAFFSTFPKRTEKTHPTLQDFNFSNFFRNLNEPHQKVKFQSFIKYFDWLESQATAQDEMRESQGAKSATDASTDDANTFMKVSRKVFSGKQWLTIEDWLECTVPLCALEVKHEGRIERSEDNVVQTVFASTRLGGDFLSNGWSQECLEFSLFPELIAVLLYVEALEDNEVVFVENVRQFNRISIDSNKQPFLENLDRPKKVSVCLMDAENYCDYPDSQFEEDNVLRELNKCLLAFRQNTTCPIIPKTNQRINRRLNSMPSIESNHESDSVIDKDRNSAQKRLSPIGESGRNSPKDITQIIIRQPSTSTKRSSYDSDRIANNIEKRRSWLVASPMGGSSSKDGGSVVTGPTASGRRGRFIVLGSSGECLPVNRTTAKRQMFAKSSTNRTDSNSTYSSCNSSDGHDDVGEEMYFSARTSFDDFVEVWNDSDCEKYAEAMKTARHYTFAEKLRDALRHSDTQYTESTEDSYAVDISISGSRTDADEGIRIKRGGSRGFVLNDDSLDEGFFMESVNQSQTWLEKYENKFSNVNAVKTDNNANVTAGEKTKYNYEDDSSEFSSELEEVYEQFSKWLDDPIIKENVDKLDPRDEAVLNFASGLLKRTLSESFVGVPLTEGCISSACIPAEENSMQNYQDKQKNRQILSARSQSLEVAKHKHRLAAQLIAQMNKHRLNKKDGIAAVATGNWGCGHKQGNVQLKLVIQWMSASLAGLPVLIYNTSGHEKLAKLDTVCRVLLDRKWTVGELAAATLEHAKDILEYDDKTSDATIETSERCFFEKLIGI
ncbi:uncharacterized protein LOC129580499 isoform X2 [Sitodiplosis mosellana]|uniref:uncharacterized protein LOC129580499 isoform X2 n=1 Tax=Sitodiplosis mosellana TaxID=263140 RepID=UPI00244505CB|nr:uncharacterized protein LOC129580499 isoform X2 [Sitodiplosis mosellana]XP_055326967.1 uncharacterized protein LOC129580499 isoform X2 [Sitodiplosis mosellana]